MKKLNFITGITLFLLLANTAGYGQANNPNANPAVASVGTDKSPITVGEITTVRFLFGNTGSDHIPAGGADFTISFPSDVRVDTTSLNYDGGSSIFLANWYIDSTSMQDYSTYLVLHVTGSGIPAKVLFGPQTIFNMFVSVNGRLANTPVGSSQLYSINAVNDALIAGNLITGSDDNASGPQSVLAATPGPLPIILYSFNVTKTGDNSLLDWSTSQESNSNRFDVLRSADGIVFNTIASVKAAGNSTANKVYSLVDTKPLRGKNYYKLKMIDIDGAFKFSEIRYLNFVDRLSIKVYPNPSTDIVYIDMTLKLTGKPVQLDLSGVTGQVVFSKRIANTAKTEKLDLKGFASGMYV